MSLGWHIPERVVPGPGNLAAWVIYNHSFPRKRRSRPIPMPRIFDNIDHQLLPALKTTLSVSHRSDFCVGYFKQRGWRQLDEHIEKWAGGDGECCRLLVGMQTLPQQDIAGAYGIIKQDAELDNQTAMRLKKALAEQFRFQLTLGAPTDADETGLRRLAAQIRAKKVVVKLHLRHPLHANLYLLFRHDPVSPAIGLDRKS